MTTHPHTEKADRAGERASAPDPASIHRPPVAKKNLRSTDSPSPVPYWPTAASARGTGDLPFPSPAPEHRRGARYSEIIPEIRGNIKGLGSERNKKEGVIRSTRRGRSLAPPLALPALAGRQHSGRRGNTAPARPGGSCLRSRRVVVEIDPFTPFRERPEPPG